MPDQPEIKQSLRGSSGKNVSWYKHDLTSIPEPTRHLLETYSHIPSDQVIPHILAIRENAWAIWPYPCLGKLNFLDLSISQSPSYPSILRRLTQSNQTLLDLGCCFAQDLRKLVSDGAPSENLCGFELRQTFVDLGYDLFRDRATFKGKFLVGNVLEDSAAMSGMLEEVAGKFDVVYAASIFHLFDYTDQLLLAKRVVTMSKPVPGSLILGRQRGNIKAGEYEHRTNEKGTMYRHNENSFREMWKQVGKETGTEWTVDVRLQKGEDFGEGSIPDDRRLNFEVTRK